MNRIQKKELRERQSTRQLMGMEQFTDYGLKTAAGELVYFLIKPDNLSVLSSEGVRGRVLALTNLLRGLDAIQLLALDSRESFQRNKDWYHTRHEQEDLPALRELLEKDARYLDDIQASTASSREFALMFQIERQKGEDAHGQIARLEKNIRDQGFHVRRTSDQDLKRLLAVYYQQDVTTEHFENIDGERWLMQDA